MRPGISQRSKKIQQLAALYVRKAADFFEKNPDRWTTETNARDKKGRAVSYTSRSAHCFCMHGKIRREFERGMSEQPLKMREDVWSLIQTSVYSALNPKYLTYMSTYNDRKGRTVAQVVDKLRKAETRIQRIFD